MPTNKTPTLPPLPAWAWRSYEADHEPGAPSAVIEDATTPILNRAPVDRAPIMPMRSSDLIDTVAISLREMDQDDRLDLSRVLLTTVAISLREMDQDDRLALAKALLTTLRTAT